MKLWEIVKGMSEGKYEDRQKFVNKENGEFIIEIFESELLYSAFFESLPINSYHLRLDWKEV